MLTKLIIRNFKRFEDVEIELGNPTVFVGPNNSGKTTALQALALWGATVRHWRQHLYGLINRPMTPSSKEMKTLGASPDVELMFDMQTWVLPQRAIPAFSLPERGIEFLHRNRVTFEESEDHGGMVPFSICIEIARGAAVGKHTMIFSESDPETLRVNFPGGPQADLAATNEFAKQLPDVRYVPSIAGLRTPEWIRQPGEVESLINQGLTGEILRNYCWRLSMGGRNFTGTEAEKRIPWERTVDRIERLFGFRFLEPTAVGDEIRMSYRPRRAQSLELDLASAGRGVHQTLLLLAYLETYPGSILLLDEPDAHLEILNQKSIYRELLDAAKTVGSQLIMTTHSEALLEVAVETEAQVISFVGQPHSVKDRGQQVLKALRVFGHEQYLLAEQRGWVLYCEGETDLLALQSFAELLNHGVRRHLESPHAQKVGKERNKAEEHFYGIREGKRDLLGFALLDHPDGDQTSSTGPLEVVYWKRREIENYFASPETLLRWAEADGLARQGEPATVSACQLMAESIRKTEESLLQLRRPSAWHPDTKVSDDVLPVVFGDYFAPLGLPNRMNKSDYHELIAFMQPEEVDPEVIAVLDGILAVAQAAQPVE